MIRSQTISGPYVRKAIESIQSFLLAEVLLGDPQHTRDALDEIVAAVTRCVMLGTIFLFSLFSTLSNLISVA